MCARRLFRTAGYAAGSDAYQKVLLQKGHLKETVAFDAASPTGTYPLETARGERPGDSHGDNRGQDKAIGHTLPEPFSFQTESDRLHGRRLYRHYMGNGRYNGPTPGIKTVGKLGATSPSKKVMPPRV